MNDLREKKTARRGNGEGTIYRRKNGTWAAALTMGVKPDGKPDRRFRYGRTRAEALEKLRALQSQALKPPPLTPTSITVGDWLELWLENYARPNIRQSTYENYRLQIQTHLIPGLGAIPLEKLAASDVQLFLKELLSNGRCPKGPSAAGGTAGPGLAPSSIVYIRNILKAALEQAVLEQKIPLNPAKQTKIPKVPKREMTVLSREEVSRFLASASRCRDYPAYLLALSTGIRRGELLGLSWRQVDFGRDWETLDCALPWNRILAIGRWDIAALERILAEESVLLCDHPCIVISQQLSDLRDGPRLTAPKTEKSRRVLELPRDAALALLLQRAMQKWEQHGVGDSYNPDGLVFCTPSGGYIQPRAFTRTFQAALKRAGVKRVRFHDLRHTVATVLLEEGKALNTVQELLGHYDPAFTASQYGHVTNRMRSEATEALGSLVHAASTLSHPAFPSDGGDPQ